MGVYTDNFHRSMNGRRHERLYLKGLFKIISKYFFKEGKKKQGKEEFRMRKWKREGSPFDPRYCARLLANLLDQSRDLFPWGGQY